MEGTRVSYGILRLGANSLWMRDVDCLSRVYYFPVNATEDPPVLWGTVVAIIFSTIGATPD